MSTPNLLYYGKAEALPQQIPLRAGPLSLIYENGDLRYIKLGERELVRRLYVAVRDRNWGTLTPHFSNIQMDIQSDAFHIHYDVENKQGDIHFVWQGEISGDSQGAITFRMEGEAHSTFLRNRIGFCLLHPMSCAGANARIHHVNGTVETSAFPVYIAPQWVLNGEIKPVIPFNEMQAVAHEVQPGLWAEIRFSGDIFEMEDQRNWTDASFKTYSTPLRLPFPVEIQQGTRITQSVTLTLQGDKGTGRQGGKEGLSKQADAQEEVRFVWQTGSQGLPLPALGLGMASHGQPLSEQELARLRALHLAHLRVDLQLAQPDVAHMLHQANDQARALGIPLEVALHLSDAAEAELARLVTLLREVKPQVAAWLIFHTREKSTTVRWIALARTALTQYDAHVRIGGGTNVYFTELNRGRPPVEQIDLVAYSINPQVHAFDNASLVETLAAQAVTVTSARQFCGDLPLVVSPVTLQPRFNPNATAPDPQPAPGELPPQVDVRQMSLFGAGWTLGSIKYLAESGAHSLTYYETTGWRGVMEVAQGSSAPAKFPSMAGAVFPLYHVLAAVGEFANGVVIPATSSQPLAVDGLVLHQGNRQRVLLANFTDHPQNIVLTPITGAMTLRQLDAERLALFLHTPEHFRHSAGVVLNAQGDTLGLSLPPYAFAQLDN
jgi:hypothetical protein